MSFFNKFNLRLNFEFLKNLFFLFFNISSLNLFFCLNLVFEDVPLFMGLIKDLFPNMDIKRKPFEKKDRIIEIMKS
jgi:hypothetical protein